MIIYIVHLVYIISIDFGIMVIHIRTNKIITKSVSIITDNVDISVVMCCYTSVLHDYSLSFPSNWQQHTVTNLLFVRIIFSQY